MNIFGNGYVIIVPIYYNLRIDLVLSNTRMKLNLKAIRIITFLVLGAIVISILAVDRKELPDFLSSLYAFPNGDKVMHFFLYGILAFLFNLSYPNTQFRFSNIRLPAGSMGVLSMAIIEEISQFFIAFRTPSLLDLACGLAGIVIIGTLGYFLGARKPDSNL